MIRCRRYIVIVLIMCTGVSLPFLRAQQDSFESTPAWTLRIGRE